MEKVKEGDFVKLEYTGSVKTDGYIFDTTSKDVAKENDIFNAQATYGPVTVCLGKAMVIKGLEDALIGKELGFEGKVEVPPDDAFGKKDPKLMKLIPTSKFKKHNVNPQPGLQVDVDGSMGFIRTVTGGRTIVDFNHPLSGKELEYDVKILNKVTDIREQISSVLTMKLNIKPDNYVIDLDDKKASIKLKGLPEMPEDLSTKISDFIKSCVDVDEVSFIPDGESGENPSGSSDVTSGTGQK
ncbi:MAG: peptidylprolyl isomerase [Candidatus Woesearchaeota archaeon]